MSQLFKLFSLFCLAIMIQQGSAKTVKMCLTDKVELDKCTEMKKVLEAHKTDCKLECTLDRQDGCIRKVKSGEVDIMSVDTTQQKTLKDTGLETLLWETYPTDNVIVAIGDIDMTPQEIQDALLLFKTHDIREMQSAALLNHLRKGKTCEKIQPRVGPKSIRLIRSTELRRVTDKELICTDLTRKPLTETQSCNMDTGSVTVVVTKQGNTRRTEIIETLEDIVRELGPGGKLSQEVEIFGTFNGDEHVIFTDDAVKLETERTTKNGVDERKLTEILCDGTVVEHLTKKD